MAAILQPYVVPIITQDLDNQETLQDVFYSLERLSGTIDDIFLHIDKRLTGTVYTQSNYFIIIYFAD